MCRVRRPDQFCVDTIEPFLKHDRFISWNCDGKFHADGPTRRRLVGDACTGCQTNHCDNRLVSWVNNFHFKDERVLFSASLRRSNVNGLHLAAEQCHNGQNDGPRYRHDFPLYFWMGTGEHICLSASLKFGMQKVLLSLFVPCFGTLG